MKTTTKSHIPVGMALNMLALIGGIPSAKKYPQEQLLKKLFTQESPASNDPINRDENAKPESFDRAWFGNYE